MTYSVSRSGWELAHISTMMMISRIFNFQMLHMVTPSIPRIKYGMLPVPWQLNLVVNTVRSNTIDDPSLTKTLRHICTMDTPSNMPSHANQISSDKPYNKLADLHYGAMQSNYIDIGDCPCTWVAYTSAAILSLYPYITRVVMYFDQQRIPNESITHVHPRGSNRLGTWMDICTGTN